MSSTKAWILAVAFSLPIAAATAEPAKASASVSLSYFYDSLSGQGDWFASAEFGHVWRPYGVSTGWRPYSDGRWVNSDVGWTFVSSSSWGWAPYHYGRWYLDPRYGWVWIPGTEWAPAWVTFYEGPGWIGWAPLPPRVSYSSWRGGYVDPRSFCFVESRHFLDSNVNRRLAPLSYNTRLVRSTRDISRFSRHRNVVVNAGPSIERIEKATGSRVRKYRLAERTDVARVSRTQIRGDAIEVFRPRITSRVTHLPKVKEDRAKNAKESKSLVRQRSAGTGHDTLEQRRGTAAERAKVDQAKSRDGSTKAMKEQEREGKSSKAKASQAKSSKTESSKAKSSKTKPSSERKPPRG